MADGSADSCLLANLASVAEVTFTVRARPGASRTEVGGAFGQPAQLVVRVSAPAVDGRANSAVKAALAEAFDVPASSVQIVIGATSRTKTVRIQGQESELRRRLSILLGIEEHPPSDLFAVD